MHVGSTSLSSEPQITYLLLFLILSGRAGAQPLTASKKGRESVERRREGAGGKIVERREEGRRATGKEFLPAGHEYP